MLFGKGKNGSGETLSTPHITFPTEEGLFKEHVSATFIPGATQCNLQAVIDHHHYDKLFASVNLNDQARLTALAHSSGASSGWLKALPLV